MCPKVRLFFPFNGEQKQLSGTWNLFIWNGNKVFLTWLLESALGVPSSETLTTIHSLHDIVVSKLNLIAEACAIAITEEESSFIVYRSYCPFL